MKNCRKCNQEKSINDFYVHKQMLDGRLNICKACVKAGVAQRYKGKVADPAFIETERERGRNKYHRLYKGIPANPKTKSKIMAKYKSLYPEKVSAHSLVGSIKFPAGIEKHHWSYKPEHAKDIIPLPTPDHALIHRFIEYDQNNMMYRTKDGELLDTKEKHERFILSLIKKSA